MMYHVQVLEVAELANVGGTMPTATSAAAHMHRIRYVSAIDRMGRVATQPDRAHAMQFTMADAEKTVLAYQTLYGASARLRIVKI